MDLTRGGEMVRAIAAVRASSFYNENPQPRMKYYQNNQNKEVVKRDFKIMLDSEIKKLKIDILI